MTVSATKYLEAASVLQELFSKGQEVINRLSETEIDAYLNKKQIDEYWFYLKKLEGVVGNVESIITIVLGDHHA